VFCGRSWVPRPCPGLEPLLSTSGIESLVGSVGWDVDDRAIDDVGARRGRGDVTFMDGLTHSRRQGIAVEVGPKLLIELLDTLRRPLARALAFEKRNRGGRPQDVSRNAVVYELAEAWLNETGESPPSGKTGPFHDLCAKALEELNLSTDGLSDSIRRTIHKRFPSKTAQRIPS
jgi:hypothetical protein